MDTLWVDEIVRCENPPCVNAARPDHSTCSFRCNVAVQNIERGRRRRAEYAAAPRLCANPECDAIIPYEQRRNAGYCSRKCVAVVHNTHQKVERPLHACAQCESLTRNRLFCTNECASAHRHAQWINDFEAGRLSSVAGRTLRRYMLEKCGNKCEICGVEEWLGQPVPVVVDHIDGNADNNAVDNLRLVCANCDGLLPTFKARNRGNGRAWRRERYHSGKSY